MDEPGFNSDGMRLLQSGRVVIWGMGLMGASLALALRRKCAWLIGIDVDPSVVSQAKQRGIVDEAYQVDALMASPEQLLGNVSCVILAAPVQAIIDTVGLLPQLFKDSVVVIDMGSTKMEIVAAMQQLPKWFDPVGGHPMCGKEKSSLEHAEAMLYKQAPFALVALERTTARAKEMAEALACAVGANPIWMSAGDHDRWVAATSHLPFLIASALAFATQPDATMMIGPGFRSTTRLANSSPRMMVDIMATNTDNIRIAIEKFKQGLSIYEELLERGDFEMLEESFMASSEHYRNLIGLQARREEQ